MGYESGAGEASIVVGMDFVPSDTSSEGISRGITVHKIIRRVDPFTSAYPQLFGPFDWL